MGNVGTKRRIGEVLESFSSTDIKVLFERIDEDKDGQLSKRQLYVFIEELSEHQTHKAGNLSNPEQELVQLFSERHVDTLLISRFVDEVFVSELLGEEEFERVLKTYFSTPTGFLSLCNTNTCRLEHP